MTELMKALEEARRQPTFGHPVRDAYEHFATLAIAENKQKDEQITELLKSIAILKSIERLLSKIKDEQDKIDKPKEEQVDKGLTNQKVDEASTYWRGSNQKGLPKETEDWRDTAYRAREHWMNGRYESALTEYELTLTAAAKRIEALEKLIKGDK